MDFSRFFREKYILRRVMEACESWTPCLSCRSLQPLQFTYENQLPFLSLSSLRLVIIMSSTFAICSVTTIIFYYQFFITSNYMFSIVLFIHRLDNCVCVFPSELFFHIHSGTVKIFNYVHKIIVHYVNMCNYVSSYVCMYLKVVTYIRIIRCYDQN